MRVILQEKIPHLGEVGDEVSVKRGFARNYLIPKGKALHASPENRQIFEQRRAQLVEAAQASLSTAQERAKALENLTVTIEAEATESGKLFGSVRPQDIVESLSQAGHRVSKSEINMPVGLIRAVGEYEVNLVLHSDVHLLLKVSVIPKLTA